MTRRLSLGALCILVLAVSVRATAGEWPVSETELARLAAGSEGDRIQAAALLPNAEEAIRMRTLASLLKDSSPEVKVRALGAAAKMRSSAATELIAPLVLDTERSVAESALDSLRSFGSVEAVPSLEQVLLSSDPELRVRAIHALGSLGGHSTGTTERSLIASLRDPEASVRRAASRALAWSGGELCLPSLSLLLRDPDVGVRTEAARALTAIGGPLAYGFVRLVAMESSPLERRAFLPAFLEMEESRAEARTLPLSLETLVEDPGAFDPELLARIARATPDPWIRRALDLARNPGQRPGIVQLLAELDLREDAALGVLLARRIRECVEQEANPLCHQMAVGLLNDADESRARAYRAQRLLPEDVFGGVDLAEHQPLFYLAIELLESEEARLRGVALLALSASSLEMSEWTEPLVMLLERKDPSREERALLLSLLGRSSSSRARALIELYERSTVPTIRHVAEDARLGQLFLDPKPDCSELSERARAIQKRPDSLWARGRSAQLSLGAIGCLLGTLSGLRVHERDWFERLLIDARRDPSPAEPNATLQDLSDQAFSLAVRSQGEERALLLQIALTLGVPEEARSRLAQGALEPGANLQIAARLSFETRDKDRFLAISALRDRALRALALSGAPHSLAELRERFGALEEVGSLPALGASLGIVRSAAARAIPESERTRWLERACRGFGASTLQRIQTIVLLGALGPEGVSESCWREATLRAFGDSDVSVRLAALLVATRTRNHPSSARVLRLCRLYEKEKSVARWCAPDPFRSAEEKEDRRLVSRRLPVRSGGSVAFLAFVASDGELSDVELGFTDRAGRFLTRANRKDAEFFVFE